MQFTQLILNASFIACIQVKKPNGSGKHCRVQKEIANPQTRSKRGKKRTPILDESDYLTENSGDDENGEDADDGEDEEGDEGEEGEEGGEVEEGEAAGKDKEKEEGNFDEDEDQEHETFIFRRSSSRESKAKRLRVDDDDAAEFKGSAEPTVRRIVMSKPKRPFFDAGAISCLSQNAFENLVSCVNCIKYV